MTDTDRQSFLSTLDFFSGCTERQLADVSHLAEGDRFQPERNCAGRATSRTKFLSFWTDQRK
jgi:hypothetical protein